jgi:hypothetical protein
MTISRRGGKREERREAEREAGSEIGLLKIFEARYEM